MDISELILNVRGPSFSAAVCQTMIQDQADKHLYAEKGYLIGFTEAEFRAMFPSIPAEHIYYIPSISDTALYLNRDTMAAAPFHSEFFAYGIVADNMKDAFVQVVAEREREVAAKEFAHSIISLPDAMRIEYFEMLVKQYQHIPDLYKLFFDVYQVSDYGFERISPETLAAVLRTKTGRDKTRVRAALHNKPDVLKVYRGGSVDKSTPVDKAYSWSLDINVANFFACRLGVTGGYIAIGEVRKEKVIDAFLDGDEKEIIVAPGDVDIVEMIDVKGKAFCEEVIPRVSALYKEYRDTMLSLKFTQASSAHGKEHEARVLLLCLTLGYMLKLPERDLKTLATAAIYHDTCRHNDEEDESHGSAARRYYDKKAGRSNSVVSFLIEYHSRPDEEGFSTIRMSKILNEQRDRVELLYKVFKDADALDRVRFGLKDLDMRFLRLPESRQLTLVANIYHSQIKV